MAVIDGKALSLTIREELRDKIAEALANGKRPPCLAVVIVGNDPASRSYVRGKVKAAAFTGMDSRLVELSEDVSEDALLRTIAELNDDPLVDGLLVQLPLPPHIDEERIMDAIALEKDVDGFHPRNVAFLWLGRPCTVPCTPKGIMRLIESSGTRIEGSHAVVVGRSNIVGKPVAKLLLDGNATVTLAHSRTPNLKEVTLQADILVVAVGRPGIITGDMIKPGATVIDVGINRCEDGVLRGDVDFGSAESVAAHITPVPGGVGPMTIAMLMENTYNAWCAMSERK